MKKLFFAFAIATVIIACNDAAEDATATDNTSANADSIAGGAIVDTAPPPAATDSLATIPDTARQRMKRAIRK